MESKLRWLLCAFLAFCWSGVFSLEAQQSPSTHKPVVISQTHPKDSEGETVYDEQDASQPDATVVPGILVHPEYLTVVKPKVPMSARAHHRKITILIEGVVTAKGDVIDIHVLQDDAEPDLAENCANAFGRDKLKPATLDGKPVAVLLQVPFSFNVF